MTIYLKQSTASQEVPLGYFVDSTDGNTEETALTIANTDIKLHKAGATTLANKNSGGATHISNGIYYAVLDATDTNTVGSLVIYCHVSGALPVKVECDVLPANVFDSRYGTDLLDVSTTQLAGQTVTASAGVTFPTSVASPTNITAASGITVSSIGANVITATSIASNAITSAKIATGAITSTQLASGAITATSIATDAITSTKIAASALNGKGDWNIGKTGYSLTVAPLDAAGVRSAVGLASANLDTQLGDIPTLTEMTSAFTEIKGATWATTDTLEAIRDRGDAAWTTATSVTVSDKTGFSLSNAGVDAIWDEATSGHTTAGTTGKALTDAGSAGDPWSTALPGAYGAGTAGKILGDNLNATVSSRASQTSVDTVDGIVDSILEDTGTTIPAQISGLNNLSSADVNAACDTAIADASLATATNLATVDTVVDAIKAKTDQLVFTKANELDINVQSINGVTITGDGSGTPFGV